MLGVDHLIFWVCVCVGGGGGEGGEGGCLFF